MSNNEEPVYRRLLARDHPQQTTVAMAMQVSSAIDNDPPRHQLEAYLHWLQRNSDRFGHWSRRLNQKLTSSEIADLCDHLENCYVPRSWWRKLDHVAFMSCFCDYVEMLTLAEREHRTSIDYTPCSWKQALEILRDGGGLYRLVRLGPQSAITKLKQLPQDERDNYWRVIHLLLRDMHSLLDQSA